MSRDFQRAPVKYIADIQTGSGDTQDASDHGFPFYVRSERILYSADWEFEGDAVLTAGDGDIGKIFHRASGKFKAHQRVYVMNNFRHVTPDFFLYAFTSEFPKYILAGSAQSTVPSIRRHMIADLQVPLPPLPTQRRIADYLDRETAQIDAMAEALDGLVARLEERRTSTIASETHALIGSTQILPKGWRFAPFKWAVQTHFSGDWGSEPGAAEIDLPCVRVADFDRQSGTVNDEVPTQRSYTTRIYDERHLHTNDLLLEKSGGTPKNPVGRIILYKGKTGVMTTNFVQCIRLQPSHEPRFWHYVFLSAYETRFTNVHVRQTTGIQNLDMGGFFAEKFACPPLDEQRRIADHLDAETAKIDAMIAKAGELRALLDERRSALITATVTGQHPVPEEH